MVRNHGSVRVLRTAGYPEYDHVARMITRSELADVDLALAADRGHLRELRAMTTDHDKVALLRSFDPDADDDEVPDPYYGPDSGFDDVLAMTVAAAPGIVQEIRRRLDRPVTNTREHPAAAPDSRPRRRWAFLLRPGWIAIILAAFAFAAACFLLLSPWQFDRNSERSAQNTAIDASITAPAVPVTDLLSTTGPPPQDVSWRVVTATGEFDPARQL